MTCRPTRPAALLLPALLLTVATCGEPPVSDTPADTAATTPVMTRQEIRARLGVASITPDLLDAAARQLPIGVYKDYHGLGALARARANAADPAERGGSSDAGPPAPSLEYVPVIQYKQLGDTPEVREVLRTAAASGQFPMPAGVSVDEMLATLERPRLETLLIQWTADGILKPRTLLLLGNEPGYAPNHDPRTPQQIVEDARLIRDILDRNGLEHRLALGGIATPDMPYNTRAYRGVTGLEFFEQILDEATRREVTFDAFAIHPYPVSGTTDPAEWRTMSDPDALVENSIGQVRAFRRIMRRHGHRDTPLVIGEIGVPFPFDVQGDELACGYADRLLTWCLTATDPELGAPHDGHRLVQRVFWFLLALPDDAPAPGLDNPAFDGRRSVLLTPDGKPTALGRTFNAVADRLAPASRP